MDPVTGSIIAGGASGAGGLLGSIMTNHANAKQAQRQMDFQLYMSNTAHQREVADLRKAGLNPILSANSGAPMGSGAMATMENSLGSGINSALESLRLRKELGQADSQIQLNKATGEAQRASALRDASTAKNVQTQTRLLEKELPAAQTKETIYRQINKGLDEVGSAYKHYKKFGNPGRDLNVTKP